LPRRSRLTIGGKPARCDAFRNALRLKPSTMRWSTASCKETTSRSSCAGGSRNSGRSAVFPTGCGANSSICLNVPKVGLLPYTSGVTTGFGAKLAERSGRGADCRSATARTGFARRRIIGCGVRTTATPHGMQHALEHDQARSLPCHARAITHGTSCVLVSLDTVRTVKQKRPTDKGKTPKTRRHVSVTTKPSSD
jgi:hypothetical protein